MEGAFALSALLLLLFGLFDLGIAVLRHNMLSVAAHAIARSAVVRGSATATDKAAWGPQTYTGNMGNGSLQAQAASDYLTTMPASQVALTMSWPDGTNDVGDRVSVTLSYQHTSITPLLSSLGTFNLRGSATLHIQE